MRRPLVAVVSGYTIGLLLGELSQPPWLPLFLATFLVLALALVISRLRRWLVWPLLALTGWTNLVWHTAVLSPEDLRAQLGNDAAIATVRGTLTETPHLKIGERDGEPTEHSLAPIKVSTICRDGNWRPASGEIMVATPGTPGTNFFAGQPVEISGVIAPPPLPLAEGLFDYRDFLQTRGIFYELKTSSANDWKILEPHRLRPPLTDRFLNWSRQTLALGLPVEDEPLRLLWAMTLGWRTAFSGDIDEPFLKAGTMHLFAIDGLRIALLSGMIVTLLRVLRLSRAWCGAVAIPLIWFYTAATGWEPSASRASVMMTILLGGWALKRPSDTINSLAAAAFIILLWDPRQLFEASFQLSFFVVLVIALMLPPLNKFFDRLLRHDPFLPDDLLPRWRRTFVWLLRMFARYCALSFAAWLGSIPLSAKYFHLFSPVSTLANLFAVPLGTLALMANLGALVTGHWLPWATSLFNHAAWFFMSAMNWVSCEAAKTPGAFFYVPAPSWPAIGIFYGALIFGLSGWLNTARRKILAATVLICTGTFYFCQWEKSRAETDLTVLPLSGGHAIFVDADGRANDCLINCGTANAVEFTLKPFLRAQGVNQIPRLVLTECDAREGGGAQSLDELFGIGELWTSGVKFRSSVYRETVASFENAGHLQGRSRHKVLNGGDLAGCWQILTPVATNNFLRADDNALVLLGNFHGTKILLLSDLGRAGQDALLEGTNDLRADLVVAGLPDEGEPLGDALLAAIQPKVLVIADSEFPAQRRAGRELKERLAAQNVPVIYTRTAGAVKIVTDANGWKLQTMDGQKFNSAASSN